MSANNAKQEQTGHFLFKEALNDCEFCISHISFALIPVINPHLNSLQLT